VLSKLIKIPLLKRLIPSISIRILNFIKKNRGYYRVQDFMMYLDFLDPIDREIILQQEFEKAEVNYLINSIKKNNISFFFDVGANCGYYSIIIAKNIDKIKIFSFEPNDEAYFKFSKTLEKNIDLLDKIKPLNFGLSDTPGKFKMQSLVKFGYAQTGGSSVINNNYISKNFITEANFKIGDDVIKLNNQKIALKIDVEGHEINVIKGLEKTLKNNHFILQIEIFKKNFSNVNNYLNSLNYNLFYELKNKSNYYYSNFNHY
tara:strand:- start:100 stop:879 length:780 start_codon:yes stop_codon:yes gene_type:complete